MHSNKTRAAMFQKKVRMNNLMSDCASTGSLLPMIKRTGIQHNYYFIKNNRAADSQIIIVL